MAPVTSDPPREKVLTEPVSYTHLDVYKRQEFTVKAAAASDDIQPPQTGDDQTGDSDNSGTSTGDTVSPQTGDSSNVVLWVSLLFASGVGLFGAAVYSRKRKYSK